MNGIVLIAQERNEQIQKHGRSSEHDRRFNNHYQLTQAVSLLVWVDEENYGNDIDACCPSDWDVEIWRKMMSKPYFERVKIAGALCVAELDRIILDDEWDRFIKEGQESMKKTPHYSTPTVDDLGEPPTGDEVCTCGVPNSRHGTCCGWHNAHTVYFPWESIIGNPSAEERELRYLISTSPNGMKLAHFMASLTK